MTGFQKLSGLVAVLVGGAVLASPGGVTSAGASGCNQCHAGGTAPVVVVDGPSSLESGASAVFELTLTTPNGTHGGFFLSASKAGTFTAPGPGVKVVNAGAAVTHSAPKAESSADSLVHFTATWTPAAATVGNVTLTGWGNSVNGADGNQGDKAASDTFVVCVKEGATAACAGKQCGTVSDGCGGMITCAGTCSGRQTCGGGGTPNVCGCAAGTISAETCNGQDDNCDGTIDNGALCSGGQTCQSGSCVGGPVADAGTDAGSTTSDAGSPTSDAGTKVDAGSTVADAGSNVDAGGDTTPEPAGGCNSSNGPVAALLALAALAVFARRRKSA